MLAGLALRGGRPEERHDAVDVGRGGEEEREGQAPVDHGFARKDTCNKGGTNHFLRPARQQERQAQEQPRNS